MIVPTLAILAIIGGSGGMVYIIASEYKKYKPPKPVTHYEEYYIDTDEYGTIVYPRRVGIDIYV